MMTKTDEELEAILAGTEGVTPGPWDFQQTDFGMSDMRVFAHSIENKSGTVTVALVAPQKNDENAAHIARLDPETVASIVRELLAYRRASPAPLQAQTSVPAGTWPDFIAPPKYENAAPGWTDPKLPDFRKIWEAAKRCGYAVGLHGSMKRDCDLIATPWAENALAPESLIEELCKTLNAREVGNREAKPGCRVAVNLQVDGWVKLIDLSIVGIPQSPLVTALPTLTWPDGTIYQFSIEQGRRAIAAALAASPAPASAQVTEEPTWELVRETLGRLTDTAPEGYRLDQPTRTAAIKAADFFQSIGARPAKLFPHCDDALVFTWDAPGVKRYYTVHADADPIHVQVQPDRFAALHPGREERKI